MRWKPLTRRLTVQMFKTVGGLRYLAISEPSAKKSYHRVAWAQYADGTDMEAAVKATDGQQVRAASNSSLARVLT